MQSVAGVHSAQAQIEPRPPYFESSLRLTGLYYDDSDSNRRYDKSLQLGLLLDDDLQFDLHTLHHDASSKTTSEELLQSWAILSKKLGASEFISAGVGVASYEDSERALGSLRYYHRKPKYFLLGELAHKPLVDTKDILENRVRYTQMLVEGDYELHARFRPRIKSEYNEYTDNNGEVRAKLDIPYRFLLSPVNSQIGYRIEYAKFRRQSGSGYFDPSELVSNQGFLAVWSWSETAWYYFEISSGQQAIRRNGSSNTDTFVAFYSEMEFRIHPQLSVGAFLEGGDYSLASASGFTYFQGIATLIWHFDGQDRDKAVARSLTLN